MISEIKTLEEARELSMNIIKAKDLKMCIRDRLKKVKS